MTGVLPVALGDAVKLVRFLMESSKEYVAVMQLHKEVDIEVLKETVEMFKGKIYQKPPVRSSVKRTLRIREVLDIEVLEYEHPYALIKVSCEHGTYIRKLIHDIGDILGVGAHMRELRRTRTGPFKETDLIRMHELSEYTYIWREKKNPEPLRKTIKPGEYIVAHLPKVIINDIAVSAITYGADLTIPGISLIHEKIRKGDTVAIFSLKGELVAIGKAQMHTEEVLQTKKGIFAKTERVIMSRGKYPPLWKKHTLKPD
ncbi:MAG: RNA-guided pseudouridylation complex pseudouridine synthase subunit Cbf5 [Desulfurococcaceae archaeon TW002]